MKKMLAVAALAFALSGCAGFGLTIGSPPEAKPQLPSPEAQIVFGANLVTAASTLGETLLKNDKITVANAKSYSAILHTASGHLHTSADRLAACRKATGSSSATRPDPCAPTVMDDINLAIAVAGDVKKVLGTK